MSFSMRHSIHGRRLGLTSSGGVVASPSGSTTIGQAAQMWGDDSEIFETVSAAGATISNSGVTVISTDSTSGAAFVVSAPITGISKEIHFQTSATAHTLGTTATTIKFNSTLAESAAGGSTTLTVTGAAGGIAGVVVMRGLSGTAWGLVSHTANVSS